MATANAPIPAASRVTIMAAPPPHCLPILYINCQFINHQPSRVQRATVTGKLIAVNVRMGFEAGGIFLAFFPAAGLCRRRTD